MLDPPVQPDDASRASSGSSSPSSSSSDSNEPPEEEEALNYDMPSPQDYLQREDGEGDPFEDGVAPELSEDGSSPDLEPDQAGPSTPVISEQDGAVPPVYTGTRTLVNE